MRNDWIEQRVRELPGKSKAGLARHLGLPFARISEIIRGQRGVKAPEVPKIAEYLETPTETVLQRLADSGLTVAKPSKGRVPPHEGEWKNPPQDEVLPAPGMVALRLGPRDLPIYGAAECGPEGVVNFDQDNPIDWTWRAPELMGVREAFGVFAHDDSMGDAIPEGSIVQIHPHRGPVPGRKCLVMLRNHGALLKIWVGRRGDRVVVRQTNPPKELSWPVDEVQAVYRVIAIIEG